MDDVSAILPAISHLIAAGGPRKWSANCAWPLHLTLAEFRTELTLKVDVQPAAGLGWSVPGVEQALVELRRLGILRLDDEGFSAWWVVEETTVAQLCRKLMRQRPEFVREYHRAACRWAALSATSAKNVRKPLESSGSTSRSGKARLQDALPGPR